MSDITVNITTISTSVNVTDNEVSVAVSFIPVDVTLNFEYGVSRAVIDSLLTKENITGLKETDSPKFSDSLITPLATEATYTPAVWAYLVGLFTTVPKSVLQHLVKLWGVVENLAVRVGLLEDKLVLEYIVPVDTFSVVITQDKNGNPLNLTGEVEICRLSIFGCNNATSNVNTMYINDINQDIYKQSYGPAFYGINSKGGYAYCNTRHNIIIANSSIFWISEIECANDINTSPSPYRYVGHSISSLQQINSITKLEFKDGDGTVTIKTGTIITIRRK